VSLRDAPPSPDGGVIGDFLDPFEDRAALAARLDAAAGVVGHGIFAPALTADVLIATGGRIDHRVLR